MQQITTCDESPIKDHIKKYLEEITHDMQNSLGTIEDEGQCMLSRFERIRDKFLHMESIAASFYLNCYLSPFTDKYRELSSALQHMSERGHGALIVVQRQDPLDSFLHSGLPVGADVSAPLLESIFYPGNPLHDGAVLVQNNKIVSAANVLPVSKQIVKGQKLGTRHRAAIGLSEKSDALILVVSEETGRMSFAFLGTLHPIVPHRS